MRSAVRKAFTLVEILIVVVILGILAAIVVPQFTNATADAQAGNVKSQISSLQNQVELFRAKNNVYPDLAGTNQWGWLDGSFNPDGTAGTATTYKYIKSAPSNPVNGSKTIVAAPAAGCGWVYKIATGTLDACYYDHTTGAVTPTDPTGNGHAGN